MRLIDMHCDTIYECAADGSEMRRNDKQVNFLSMKQQDAMAQFFAIFLFGEDGSTEEARADYSWEAFLKYYNFYQEQLQLNRSLIRPAFSYTDILSHDKNGLMSSILAVENGELIGTSLQRLKELFQKGVRLITLTWNSENSLGFPCSSDPVRHQMGLKPFGFQAVELMNELGIIVDVSHLSEGGFYDVATHSKKPFVASHSSSRAITDHPRNLTDHQLRTLAEKGGVAGVNFYSGFLRNDDSDHTTLDNIMAHLTHMVDIAGTDHIALGSDFDGIEGTVEVDGYRHYDLLVDQLMEQYPEKIVEKICYKNVLRIIKECM